MPLKRQQEPELMLSVPEAREYAAIDHSAQNRELALLAAGPLGFRGGSAADLGAGDGALAEELCRAVPAARVTAVELSPAMLALARRRFSAAGLSRRVSLAAADAKATGLPGGAFDLVVCSNLVHHISDPRRLFREAARLLRPGGGLLFLDLLRPAGEAALAAQLRRCAGDTPAQRSLLEASLRASLTLPEVRACLRGSGLRGAALSRWGGRHWLLRRGCSPVGKGFAR